MLSAGLAEKQNKISEGGNKWLYIQAPMSCIFKVGGKKTVLRISPSTKLCGAQTNKAKQVQIKQSTLAPFIQLGLLQLVWPHVFDAL